MAYALRYRSPERTLTDAEVSEAHAQDRDRGHQAPRRGAAAPDVKKSSNVGELTGFAATLRLSPMTKADIIEGVYEQVGFSKKESAEIVELVFDTLKETLERGDKVKISGFGNFQARYKQARAGAQPPERAADRDHRAPGGEVRAQPGAQGRPERRLRGATTRRSAEDDDDSDDGDETDDDE